MGEPSSPVTLEIHAYCNVAKHGVQAWSSFKAGDWVIYSDKHGVEERGVILTVYPDDRRCKFQAVGTHNVTHRVAASDLILNQADWVRFGLE